MKDMLTSLEKLRADAAEAALIRHLATDPLNFSQQIREIFAEHNESVHVVLIPSIRLP